MLPGDHVDQVVVHLVGVQVVEPHPVEGQLAQLGKQLPQPAAAIEIGAVAGDVLGDDDQLLHPPVGQGLGLGEQGLHAPAAVAAPEIGDDAVGAAVVAALGNLQVGGVGRRGHHPGPVLLRVVDVAEAAGMAADGHLLQGGDDVGVAAGAQHAVHLGHLLLQLVLVPLGQAAGHQQLAQLARVLQGGQLQDVLDGLALGGVDEAAGVEHRHVRPLRVGHQLIPGIPGQGHHLFGIDQILGAAQGDKCNLQ